MLRDLLPVVPVTAETHEAGIALAERYGFSIYDAMIAASAILRHALVGRYAARHGSR
jgi:predicted nucleic acid-binding protein